MTDEEYERQEHLEYLQQLDVERKRQFAIEQRERMEKRFSAIEGNIKWLAERQKEFALNEALKKTSQEEIPDIDYTLQRLQKIHYSERERAKYNIKAVARKEYMLFCFWCNTEHAICKQGKDGIIDVALMEQYAYHNESYLMEYMQKEKPYGFERVIPDYHIQKEILETYFGYTFAYNEKLGKWQIFKKQVAAV